MGNYFSELGENVISAKQERVRELTQRALADGVDPVEIINSGLIPGMNVVGARFKAGDMFVPEVLMSARAMNAGMELVKPLLVGKEVPSQGKVVLGTVKGDLHDIGKNLVSMMLESAGYTVINLGVDVSAAKFLQAVKENKPDILGMSALLTTTMLGMKDVIELLKEEGLRDQVKVVIGGAPISQEFAREIGADGFAPDAGSATELCHQLVAR
ncbi:Methyltransferase cognate corrinoid protein [Acididesulfobacillus acetoxydans]|uniref:Dimethylamine corrinoid protein 3 n=1 Tax=Acididesulfobacillus acetoxydans TaxID=1561005 RepID=A0A8S0XWG7_9FIRM|nr:corrinoid protein [Acididesulfobacillus acetoxydans]CAA7601027.1 Methyltransferase cognate corrinoid protein [Acididesulfobacillus acetoxydans]CEJ06901.1 Dimethylamine corrinoid protein 3 [Acididesulfobacillus acetoxydans]